jgi:predicted nucleotidyltransferase
MASGIDTFNKNDSSFSGDKTVSRTGPALRGTGPVITETGTVISRTDPDFKGYDTVKTIEVVTKAVKIYAYDVRRVFPVVKAFLFGSWARGTPTKYSDVDVCFFMESYGERNKIEVLIELSMIKLDFYWLGIEPHVYLASCLNQDHLFVEEILRTGIEI